jgi:hypothetical protein
VAIEEFKPKVSGTRPQPGDADPRVAPYGYFCTDQFGMGQFR